MRGYIIVLFSILTFSGCFTSSKISNRNLSYIYTKESGILHPKFIVFHISDTISRIYYLINSKELLYSRENDKQEFTANFAFSYRLYQSLESKELLDSASKQHLIPAYKNPEFIGTRSANAQDYSYRQISKTGQQIINYIDFKAGSPNTYLLEAAVFDIKRNQTAKTFINIDKRTKFNRQNFLIESQAKETPVFSENITSNEYFSIHCNDPYMSALFVGYFKMNFPISLPPFSVESQKSLFMSRDSAFVLQFSDSNIATFQLQKDGVYHFQIDTVIEDGLTLFRYYDDFPKVTSVEQLIEPLRYITTKQEYEEMLNHENKKTALDNFWLKATGNPDRGKHLIREYYNRIQDANEFFTSYMEGWKTDRGMIYIVYGIPDIVYKSSASEIWIYGEENNLMSLNFAFDKISNSFTDNDYVLNRSPIYKSSWYNAVEAWRQGIVY